MITTKIGVVTAFHGAVPVAKHLKQRKCGEKAVLPTYLVEMGLSIRKHFCLPERKVFLWLYTIEEILLQYNINRMVVASSF